MILQTPDGGKIKVSDVATVVDGFEDKDTANTLVDVETGRSLPLLGLAVMSSSNMNVVKTSKSVNEWIDSKQGSLPEGMTLQLWTDQSELYKGRMNLIVRAAYGGLILVFFILMLFLRPAVAIWC